MTTKFYDCITMLRFNKTKVVKQEFYGAKKPPIKPWGIAVNSIAISKMIKPRIILTSWLDI